MKSYRADLLTSNPTHTYNKNETHMAGNVNLYTLPAPYNSSQVMGAPLTKFIDVITDSGVNPNMMCLTGNGRLFVIPLIAVGAANTVLMYNFNTSTGNWSYAGKIGYACTAPATVTLRFFKVDDTNPNNIKIFIGHTSTTASMGGCLMINKVHLSDFSFVSYPIFYAAQTDDAAAVYSLQLPKEYGSGHTLTAPAGAIVPGSNSTNPSINTKLYVHNGVSATHQYFIFDYATAPLMNGMGSATSTGNTTGASTTFTVPGNTLNIGDQVVITSNPPTPYVLSSPTGTETVYYVVAANFVSGSTFSLSTTNGGAILAATSATSGTTFVRANGQCVNLFVSKTANLPSLVGTLLLTNSENYCLPGATPLSGFESIFFSTGSTHYLGKLSELYNAQSGNLHSSTTIDGLNTSNLSIGMTVWGSSIPDGTVITSIIDGSSILISASATTTGIQALTFGAINWPSLASINSLGNGTDYVVPTPTQAFYADTTDKVIFLTSGSVMMIKNWVNSQILANFGNNGNALMEAQNHVTDPLQLTTLNSIENGNGWLFFSGGTTGQRGIIVMNYKSDNIFDFSYVVSPVKYTPGSPILKTFTTLEELYSYTGLGVFYYRTSDDVNDTMFDLPTGGWVQMPARQDQNVTLLKYTQFKIACSMFAIPNSADVAITTPLQLKDFQYTLQWVDETSDYWDYSFADSSQEIPTIAGFNLHYPYLTGTVPKLYFRAYDLNNNLITQADTVNDAGNFTYSTDNGLTWLPLGTIPNTVNTRVRYTWTTPPGIDVRVTIRES